MKAAIDMDRPSLPDARWTAEPDGRAARSPPHSPNLRGRALALRPWVEAKRPEPIRVHRRYAVPAVRVFAAWLDRENVGRWLFATAGQPIAEVALEARVGGRFRLVEGGARGRIEHAGEYLVLDAPRQLVFDLVLAQRPRVVTRVSVAIAARRKGCELTLTHEHVPPDCASDVEGRWAGVLYGLDLIFD